MTATEINNRLFMSFVLGWFVGVIAGMGYGAYHWDSLQVEHGRVVLVSVSSALGTTLLLSMRVARKIAETISRG